MKRKYPARGPKYEVPPGPHYVVAIDLGKTKIGIAVGVVDGMEAESLLKAWTLKGPRGSTAAEVAALVWTEVLQKLPTAGLYLPGTIWVCEWPMKYKDKRKYHSALDSLHEVGYEIVNRLGRPWDEKYLPGEWKGNVVKKAHHQRIARALTHKEKRRMPNLRQHDAWDAAGIYLFAVGRTRRGGIL